MRTKQFKAESKKLLDMMINSIYTHKEIFLRELISNASDALDKLYYRSLTDDKVGIKREEFAIDIVIDKDARTITVSDNGCGMTAQELENNLGTIAKSGSLAFKQDNEAAEDVNIIGQFGVGFYSAFMVSDSVTVVSRAYGTDDANMWSSKGADGYTVEPCDKETVGTVITMHIKEDTEEENYSEFLEPHRIAGIVKKYSDYVRYPIRMDMQESRPDPEKQGEFETVTVNKILNSMIPLWRKNKNEITPEEYSAFYKEKFFDFEDPAHVIHSKTEGQVTYNALLFVPKRPPFDYYTKEYEKGLQLYSSGVLIMDKCADLLPDYFSFVKGLVDSEDLSLNISREMLQQDHQVKLIAKSLEKKIHSELLKMCENSREDYEEFFKSFGRQLKYGVYENYGLHKDSLKDLLMFYSSSEQKPATLHEYVMRMKPDQDTIYYACGETKDKIDMLPQVELVRDKGFEILYFTDDVDEFAVQMLMKFEDKTFTNVCADKLDLDTEEEKQSLKQENEDNKDLLDFLKEQIGDSVAGVRFTNKLKNHPVCLTSEGNLSVEMEKVLSSMPGNNGIKAQTVMEINSQHPIASKLKTLYQEDKDTAAKYAKILYSQARLIGGLTIENPTELTSMICDLMID